MNFGSIWPLDIREIGWLSTELLALEILGGVPFCHACCYQSTPEWTQPQGGAVLFCCSQASFLDKLKAALITYSYTGHSFHLLPSHCPERRHFVWLAQENKTIVSNIFVSICHIPTWMARGLIAEIANPGDRQGLEETGCFIISESKKALSIHDGTSNKT